MTKVSIRIDIVVGEADAETVESATGDLRDNCFVSTWTM